MNDSAAAYVEEILAGATIPCPPTLPPANMGQRMLYGDPFTQFGSPF